MVRVSAASNREVEQILAKILFNLPEGHPTEALAYLTQLAQQTDDPDVRARYTEVLRSLAQSPEVQG